MDGWVKGRGEGGGRDVGSEKVRRGSPSKGSGLPKGGASASKASKHPLIPPFPLEGLRRPGRPGVWERGDQPRDQFRES